VAQDFDEYKKTWATYYGGSGTDFHNIFIDSEENLIAIGELTYINSAYNDETYYNQFITSDDSQFQYHTDVFFQTVIAKFSPEGELLWSGYLPFAVHLSKIDSNDQIYIVGVTKNSSQGTSGVWLEEPVTSSSNFRFAAQLNSDFTINWLSYLPITSYVAMDIGHEGEMYCSGNTPINEGITTADAFQTDFMGNTNNNGYLVRLDNQGNLDWATYNGVSLPQSINYSKNGILTHSIKMSSANDDYYMTTDAYKNTPTNRFFSVFDPLTGNRTYSTYFDENLTNVSMSFQEGYYYFFGQTVEELTDGNLISENAFQTHVEDNHNYYLGKLDTYLNPVWGTYIGGDQPENLFLTSLNLSSLEVNHGNVYLTGESLSDNFFTSPNPYQSHNNGKKDLLIMKFTLDGDFIWGSFFGGSEVENSGNIIVESEDTFYITGSTASKTAISTSGAHQEDLDKHPDSNEFIEHPNGFISKFSPDAPLSVNSPQEEDFILYPNPTKGDLYIQGMSPGKKQIYIHNSLGQKVFSEIIETEEEVVLNLRELTVGIYFLEVGDLETAHKQTKKIIIK